MVKDFIHFIPYPDVIVIKMDEASIILESQEVREYCYSLTCFIEGKVEDKVYYEYHYTWGCSPCGGSSPCEECGACLEGRPSLPVNEFLKKLINWIKNEKRNRGLPLIEIRGNP